MIGTGRKKTETEKQKGKLFSQLNSCGCMYIYQLYLEDVKKIIYYIAYIDSGTLKAAERLILSYLPGTKEYRVIAIRNRSILVP